MSWEIQNKGFQTIFKMTWKYKNFIEKNYKIILEDFLDMIFVEFIIIFSQTLIWRCLKCAHVITFRIKWLQNVVTFWSQSKYTTKIYY
jgi:hypothetical protein